MVHSIPLVPVTPARFSRLQHVLQKHPAPGRLVLGIPNHPKQLFEHIRLSKSLAHHDEHLPPALHRPSLAGQDAVPDTRELEPGIDNDNLFSLISAAKRTSQKERTPSEACARHPA